MNERLKQLMNTLIRPRHVGIFSRLTDHLHSLSKGDAFIAGVLGTFVIVTSMVGLYALERTFLVEVPSRGGNVTEGVLGSPRFVNPLLALSDADRDLTALTYAGLMGVGSDGSLMHVLAKSHEISEDGTVYTFTLKDDLRFQDKSPVTAEDVVFTIKKAQDPGLKSPERANWANILVEAVDTRTVRFTLPKAYAPFLESTTLGILPAHLWREVGNEDFPFSPLMSNPVGAGPFVVEEIKRGRDGIVNEYRLKAYEGYALGRPFLDSMRFRFYSQETDLRSALKSGAVESAYGIPKVGALRAPFAQVFGVFFNADQNALFANIEVRKALSVAIDRDYIVGSVLGGYATALDGPVPPGSGVQTFLRDEDLSGNETGRIAKASEILESASWDFDTDTRVWKQAKKDLELRITLKTSNVPELKAVAQAVRDAWQKLGVPVEIELYEPSDLTQNVIRPRKYEAILFGMVVGREHDLFAFWSSGERNDPGLNIALYANRSVDELLESLREETNVEKKQSTLQEVSDRINADYPAAFTHTPDFIYAAPKGVRGIVLPQIASPSDRFATAALWYRHTEALWPFFSK